MKKTGSIANSSDVATKEKSYKKLINFYRIVVNPSFIETGKTSNEVIKNLFFNLFKKNTTFNMNNVTIEMIDLNEAYFFGSICRKSDLDILTEIRNAKSEKSIKNTDIIIESYTYFYISFNELAVSVIKTQKIPNSDIYIKDLIEQNCALNIDIAPFVKEDAEIKAMLANTFSLTFYDNSNKYLGLNKTSLFDCEFKELSIKAKLKDRNSSNNFLKNLLNAFKGNPDVKSLSVSTDSEDIDLLRNSFTKHVTIELSKDYKNDLSKIQQALAKELLLIIKA